jgi:integrase
VGIFWKAAVVFYRFAATNKQLEGVEPVRTAFLIAAVMGMRRGEIFGLRWKDIDLERCPACPQIIR